MTNFKKELERAEKDAREQGDLAYQDIRLFKYGLIMRDVSCNGIKPDPDLVSGKRRMVSLSEGGSIKWYSATKESVLRWITEGWSFDDETTTWANEPESEKPEQ